MPTPAPSTNPAGGIFQYLLNINGSPAEVQRAQAALAQSTPLTAAIYQGLSLLPEGDIKSWLTANPLQFWNKILQLFKGRKYTTGDYVLGERFIDNVLCQGDVGRRQVPDDIVPKAWLMFTILFGVRIRVSDDLDALEKGVDAYLTRAPHTKDMPRDAVERAVFLKQTYYNASTYNRQCWDLKWFEKYPLVAPIPDPYTPGKELYTGELPGGAYAVNGVIPVEAQTILKQVPEAEKEDQFIPVPIDEDKGGAADLVQQGISWAKDNPLAALLIGGVAAYLIYEIVNE